MEVLYPRCCGLDVHQKTIVACLIVPEGREIRTFKTMTSDLLKLADWIVAKRVTHVAMESTGVYWHPVYNVLEALGITLLVMNAQHIKAVPGRKTDVKDAEWIADLLRHSLVVGSFIPDRTQRELRELIRYRRSLIRQRVQVVNRIQKVLEGANIKLSSVASNIMGASGRAMLEAISKGVDDPEALARYAKGRLREKRPELEEALRGLAGPHQRTMLQSQLRIIEFMDGEISRMDEEIAERMRPFEEALERLQRYLSRIPYKLTKMRYSSFCRYFGHLKRLGWVEETGKTEPSGIQDSYPPAPSRVYYRLTEAGKKATLAEASNPLRLLYPEYDAAYFKEKRKGKRYYSKKK